jgi:L-arabinose isomerase
MKKLDTLEAWFFTGSQTLYGKKTLLQVEKDSQGHCPILPLFPSR